MLILYIPALNVPSSVRVDLGGGFTSVCSLGETITGIPHPILVCALFQKGYWEIDKESETNSKNDLRSGKPVLQFQYIQLLKKKINSRPLVWSHFINNHMGIRDLLVDKLKLEIRHNFLTVRLIKRWNSVVDCPSFEAFKLRLDWMSF